MVKAGIKTELMMMIFIAIVSYLIFSQFDVLEHIVAFSAKHEDFEIDEVISTSMVLAVMLAIFSIRRTAEVLAINRLLASRNTELQAAMSEIKVLKGILPICSYCKKIKDPEDQSWKQIEAYIDDHSEAQFSHSICPDCHDIPLKELETFKQN